MNFRFGSLNEIFFSLPFLVGFGLLLPFLEFFKIPMFLDDVIAMLVPWVSGSRIFKDWNAIYGVFFNFGFSFSKKSGFAIGYKSRAISIMFV